MARATLRDQALLHERMKTMPNPQPQPQRHAPTQLGPKRFVRDVVAPAKRGCPPPISPDLGRLHVSERWATKRMYPAYVDARQLTDDPVAVVDAIYRAEIPHCVAPGAPTTPAALELARRVQLAVAILMRSEGVDVSMPFQPPYPRPNPMPPVQEGWIRGLLTGWP